MKRLAGFAAALALAAAVAGCGGEDSSGSGPVAPPAPTGAVEITTLSNRADLISGDDALVAIALPAGATSAGLRVDVDGRDVTAAFTTAADGRLTGLVEGLAAGQNIVTASTTTAAAARLVVTNAGRGAVVSGPRQTPYFCATPAPQPATASSPLTNASGLTTRAVDAECTIATEYRLYYRTTAPDCTGGLPDPSPVTVNFLATSVPAAPPAPANPCFRRYVAGSAPGDLATTTTDAGVTLPYIVRVERGTINRGIYDLAVLVDPARPVSATAPSPGWNGKVELLLGGGSGQPRRQARPTPAWSDDPALARGYLVATNSMLDSAADSNRVLVAETVMMMRERIIERYGVIRHTVSVAGSGGAINTHTTISIMPGLIDGAVIRSAFADAQTNAIEVLDCVLLANAYQDARWLAVERGLTADQAAARKAAINGHVDQSGCHGWFNAYGRELEPGNYYEKSIGLLAGSAEANSAEAYAGTIRSSPTLTNNCQLPPALVFDPAANPDGVRCDAAGWARAVWGSIGGTPLQTRDNAGVQYGLKALLSGAITAEEFTTLNEIVGGVDRQGRRTPARSNADATALDIAYRSGIVVDGRRLAAAALIDLRGWNDSSLTAPPGLLQPPVNPIHFVWRSFGIRDRLVRDYGDAGSAALWRFARTGLAPPPPLDSEAFAGMNRWLAAIRADTRAVPLAQKVRAARPADLTDFCILSSDAAQTTRIPNGPQCDADPFLRPAASPRQVAGGPLAENILKCRLRAFSAADYAGRLTEAQLARLRAVFANGVCDWTAAGAGQTPANGPYDFTAGPGGRLLPAAPVSSRVG